MLIRLFKESNIIKYFLSLVLWMLKMAMSIAKPSMVNILHTLFVFNGMFISFYIMANPDFCSILDTLVYICMCPGQDCSSS